ncbi:flagellar assembly protein FliH [Photobacterium sp. GJ3]|uniref:flagellar assembly protein FliH n=1 Tax=Photobacterium sp. GJ3 TaxID=2829502 RepID=UPI0020132D83|nr:flagellar assembly protein FliH [Photobacterium sp. GJ3]
MRSLKVMRLTPGEYRSHRFPPMVKPVVHGSEESVQDLDGFSGETPLNTQEHQAALQKRLEEGFQQGLQQGYDEGLRQGTEQGRQQGFNLGQQDGFQQGYTKGEGQGREKYESVIAPLQALETHIQQWQNEREHAQREQICSLVQKVAQQVIRAELTLMPQQILALVEETLDSMPGNSDKVVVHLNPQDLERINNLSPTLHPSWKLVANKEMPIGGVQLVTEHAEADASSDARLEACMETLREHLLEENQQPAAAAETQPQAVSTEDIRE